VEFGKGGKGLKRGKILLAQDEKGKVMGVVLQITGTASGRVFNYPKDR